LDATNPFQHLPLFRETADGRYVVALNIYHKLSFAALNLLRCGPSVESMNNAILQWRAEDLENAAAEAGLFDKSYAQATAGSSDEHAHVAPDLFAAETPMGTYQGMTDQVVLSRTPGSFKTVLVPRGSSKPEWLAH
jgi:hypothetical protein